MDQAAYFAQMREKRKNEILDMTREMILSEGILSFQMQQLAKRMDVSNVTLYKYFKNSQDVMTALRDRTLRVRREGSFSQVKKKEEADPAEEFFSCFQKVYGQLLENREDLTLLAVLEGYLRGQAEEIGPREYLRFLTGRSFEELLSLLEQAREEGELSGSADEKKLEETLDFIADLNMAMIRQIALLENAVFEEKKDGLRRELEGLCWMYRLFLEQY